MCHQQHGRTCCACSPHSECTPPGAHSSSCGCNRCTPLKPYLIAEHRGCMQGHPTGVGDGRAALQGEQGGHSAGPGGPVQHLG